jgi:sulfur-carrier protein
LDNSDLAKGLAVPTRDATVTVLYFARLKEALGLGAERVPLTGSIGTVAALREHLRSRGGAWELELAPSKPVRVAVNQEMAAVDARIGPGDEIAFFPPVTGG